MRSCLMAIALAIAPLSALTTSSQPLHTDVLVGGIAGDILRVDPQGKVTTMVSSLVTGARFINMLTMDSDNQSVIALDALNFTTPNRVLRVDPITKSVSTVWSGAPLTSAMSFVRVDQDGDYLVADGANLFKIKPDGSSLATYIQGAGLSLDSFALDVNGGVWLLGSKARPQTVYHVDRATRTTIAAVAIGTTPTSMAQDPQRDNVYITGVTPAILNYSPRNRTWTTLVPGSRTFVPNAMTVDRAPATSGALLYAGMSRPGPDILRIDRNGTILGTLGNVLPARILGMTFDRSRNLAPTLLQAPNRRTILVSFPGDALKPFVLAISLLGAQPGVSLPDGRVIPLVPDLFTVLTTQGPLGPILTGNIGVLGTNGSAAVTFDANPLGVGARGLKVWIAAASLDRNAPSASVRSAAPC